MINPYYSEGYGYPGLGMVNPYYSEGYGYSNLGLGAISPGKVFTPAQQSGAASYNRNNYKRVGWEADVTGAVLAKAVYAAQSLLFSSDKDRDGKLGPNTKEAFKAALGTAAAANGGFGPPVPDFTLTTGLDGLAGIPAGIQAGIDKIVAGGEASQSGVTGSAIVAAIGFKPRTYRQSGGGGGGGTRPRPGVPGVRHAGIGGGGDNTGMIIGVVLIGAALYFWNKKKKK